MRAPRLLWRRTSDEILVLVPGAREIVRLGGTGVDLWELLAERRAVTEVVGELAHRYGVTSEQVHADVTTAVDDLVGRGVAVWCERN